MKTLRIAQLLYVSLLALSPLTALSEGHKVWQLEAKDKIDTRWFIQDGRYYLVKASEYIHFFDGENGKELWTTEVEDIEKAGFNMLWNEEQFILSTENEELVSYDVLTGKIRWKQKYPDIDQDEYSDYDNTKVGVVLYYDDIAICVDLETGKEEWRHKLTFDSNRKGKGLECLWWLKGDNGGNRFLFATNDGLLLLDADNGKELWKNEGELSDEEEVEAVTFYGSKALIMYDNDMLGFLDLASGKELWTRKQDIGDIEGYSTLEDLDGADYLMISTDDTQLMINLTTGNVQWETKPDELIGILTDHKVLDNGKSVLGYFLQRRMGGDESGTYLKLYKLDVASGKILYKEKIAYTEYAPAVGIANFFSQALLGTKAIEEHDYGFVFDEYEVDGDLVFLIRGVKGAGGMEDPLTRDDDGEGLVRINLNTGKVAYRSYFPLNKVGFRWSAVNYDFSSAPQPIVEKGKLYVVGAERVVCADLATGKVVWEIDDDLGFPVDWGLFDNTLFLKVGYQAFSVAVDAKSGDINAKKDWNKDPYRIYALDPGTGKEFWKIDFENDPGISLRGEVKIDPASRTMYGADEEELFAVRLSRDAGGKRLWTLKFDDDMKVGELDHEDCYAVTQSSSSSTSVGYNYTTTTTSYAASARLVLEPVFRGDHFIVFGPEGVARVGLDGKIQWTTEWNWAGKKVTLPPVFLSNGKIAFMVKEDIHLLDEATGKLHWKEEDDYDATPVIPPNNKYLYMVEDDEVRVYKMTE